MTVGVDLSITEETWRPQGNAPRVYEPELIPAPRIGRYELIKKLGQGGMGRVYLARDPVLGRQVALKVIIAPDGERIRRFEREARAAAQLREHTNVVTIYDYGVSDGQPYIVSRYVRGVPLTEMPVPVPDWRMAWRLGTALASGLAQAHRVQVVHRDIKPGNVMLADNGQPMILDFGLARILSIDEDPAHGDEDRGSTHSGGPESMDLRSRSSATPLTRTGALLGTPYYMAPELWLGQPATPASDVYSLGVLLYELLAGAVPHRAVTRADLRALVPTVDAASLASEAENVPGRFASLIDRCLARAPESRPASGEELWRLLQALEPGNDASSARRTSVKNQPYPGLRPFDRQSSHFFFGRDVDIAAVLERLRNSSLVVVTGASGLGKSSLVRAGVLPAVERGQLDEKRSWSSLVVSPDRQPLAALTTALASALPGVLCDSDAPTALAEQLRTCLTSQRGLVLCIDQMEELLSLSEPTEARLFGRAVLQLSQLVPQMRIVATVRGDMLIDTMELAGWTRTACHSLYVLRTLGSQGLRRAIVQPARLCGVEFESDELVAELLQSADRGPGSLPLLQFALARLWQARDRERGRITARSLDDIGGVEGALARYADNVWSGLDSDEVQDAARAVLVRLVTSRGEPTRKSGAELGIGDGAPGTAIQTLVGARLLLVREGKDGTYYEIAHEALLTGWPRLQNWLTVEMQMRAVLERLASAATEWVQAGRTPELLWSARQLAAVDAVLAAELTAEQQVFVRASRRRVRRRRWLRVGLAVLPFLLAGLLYQGWRSIQARAHERAVAGHVRTAHTHLQAARERLKRGQQTRSQAFRCYDLTPQGQCDDLWARVLAHTLDVEDKLVEALQAGQLAEAHAPDDRHVRRTLAEVWYERAVLAESRAARWEMDEMRAQMDRYDDGVTGQRWTALRSFVLETTPGNVPFVLERYRTVDGGRLEPVPVQAGRAPAQWSLTPGSYRLRLAATGATAGVLYPFEVPTDSEHMPPIQLVVPRPGEIPDGFAYIAPGTSYYGFGSSEEHEGTRRVAMARPQRKRAVQGFFIAIYETTYARYIEYLDSLSASERAASIPDATMGDVSVSLQRVADRWWLRYVPTPDARERFVGPDVPVDYQARTYGRSHRWTRFPITGITATAARAYAVWLSDTGRVPGARLCREDEWERAARGADTRQWPHGDRLALGDANHDESHGGASGFDEAGSHPISASPFGIQDMAGNAAELVVALRPEEGLVVRSGSYRWTARENASFVRDTSSGDFPSAHVGLRICANAPAHLQ